MPAYSPTVDRLTIYPIKSLDGRSVESVSIVDNGGLAGDREFALFDSEDNYVNGKREQQIHRISADYEGDHPRMDAVRLSTDGSEPHRFTVDELEDGEALNWLSDHVGYPVSIARDPAGGFPDDTAASGPTIISTATIETVASWFDEICVESMRRRLRPNIELGGVPAFWEDRLFADRNHHVAFSIGDVSFRGVNPCQRCIVPSRDPDTGEEYEGFQSTFINKREETLPEWSGGDWFDHYFRLMLNTMVPQSEWGGTISIGDSVEVGQAVPVDE
jgi:uncharacterized protein YcbX